MRHGFSIESRRLEDTLAVGAAVGSLCRPGDVVALCGELGAGKTQLVRGLARGMGLDPRHVSSPTFVIAHEYEPDDPAPPEAPETPVLVHIDAYRLNRGAELSAMGWAGEGGDLPDGAVLAVEWAERVMDALGPDRLEVRLAHAEGGRQITLRPHGSWSARMMELRQAVSSAGVPTHE